MEFAPWIQDMIDMLDYPPGCQVSGARGSSGQGMVARADRFRLAIPYCGGDIRAEFIFDRRRPEFPPDVLVVAGDDVRQHSNPSSHCKWLHPARLPSVGRWQAGQPELFRALVCDIIDQYRLYQESVVAQHSHQRIAFEHSSLEAVKGVEWFVVPAWGHSRETVRVRVPLRIDFSDLCQQWHERQQRLRAGQSGAEPVSEMSPSEGCWLFCEWSPNITTGEFEVTTWRVEFPPAVERMKLGWLTSPQAFQGPNPHLLLCEYVTELQAKMQGSIQAAVSADRGRREMLAECGRLLGPPLQVDELNALSGSFLSSADPDKQIGAVIQVFIPDSFPRDPPSLTFMSTFNLQTNRQRLQEPISQRFGVPPPQGRSGAAWAEAIEQVVQSKLPGFLSRCQERCES
eukprot:TRINITY_DN2823_c0_g2_i1.p1 TRINITY_DN2823_c0_g2~~TRINITY_DN2823_c0_g2_i1.p1  ORF type:complete len:400 (+),score=134.66 TRINITY_DN2823_c0_g2_i1:89-1288(+)